MLNSNNTNYFKRNNFWRPYSDTKLGKAKARAVRPSFTICILSGDCELACYVRVRYLEKPSLPSPARLLPCCMPCCIMEWLSRN